MKQLNCAAEESNNNYCNNKTNNKISTVELYYGCSLGDRGEGSPSTDSLGNSKTPFR